VLFASEPICSGRRRPEHSLATESADSAKGTAEPAAWLADELAVGTQDVSKNRSCVADFHPCRAASPSVYPRCLLDAEAAEARLPLASSPVRAEPDAEAHVVPALVMKLAVDTHPPETALPVRSDGRPSCPGRQPEAPSLRPREPQPALALLVVAEQQQR